MQFRDFAEIDGAFLLIHGVVGPRSFFQNLHCVDSADNTVFMREQHTFADPKELDNAVLTATVTTGRIEFMTQCEPPKSTDQPQANIGRLCFLIAKDMRTTLDRDLARFDLRAQQAAVLMHSFRKPGSNPSLLASAVGTDTAGVTGLIDQLEAKNLVVRRPSLSDRRAVIIQPTGAGRALLPRLREVFQALHSRMLAGVSAKQKADLERLLRRLQKNLGESLMESSEEPSGSLAKDLHVGRETRKRKAREA